VRDVFAGFEVEIVDAAPGARPGLDAPLAQDLALAEGDSVEFTLTTTKDWPEPEVPSDLAAALEDADDLTETWPSLTPMARWEWVRWVGATRSEDTRARRVEVSIDKLRTGSRRPCCFDLASCTDPELARSGKLRE
jgi:hypothetical protein